MPKIGISSLITFSDILGVLIPITEDGPPDKIIALGWLSNKYSSTLLYGIIWQNTPSSLTLLAINWVIGCQNLLLIYYLI